MLEIYFCGVGNEEGQWKTTYPSIHWVELMVLTYNTTRKSLSGGGSSKGELQEYNVDKKIMI